MTICETIQITQGSSSLFLLLLFYNNSKQKHEKQLVILIFEFQTFYSVFGLGFNSEFLAVFYGSSKIVATKIQVQIIDNINIEVPSEFFPNIRQLNLGSRVSTKEKDENKRQKLYFQTYFILKLNNYFSAENGMTYNNPFLSKFPHTFYPPYSGYWPLQGQNSLSVPLNQHLPSFPNQLDYRCFLQPNNYLPTYQNFGGNVTISPGMIPVPPKAPLPLKNQKGLTPPSGFQKKSKKSEAEIVNLVSDQQEPLQVQKVQEDKTSVTNSKSVSYNKSLQNSIVNQIIEQIKEAPIVVKKKKEPKNKNIQKVERKIRFQKPKLMKKKNKRALENSRLSRTLKGPVFSKRITEKLNIKKEPFRLSKREKEQLQIGQLRELTTGLLTGPQFQAKIPSFNKDIRNKSSWLKSIRDDLLKRQYLEDSDDE